MTATTSKNSSSSKLPSEAMGHLRSFLDYLQVECGLAQNTRKAYRRDLKYFLGYLFEQGSKSLQQLRSRDIEGFLRQSHSSGLSASSIGRRLAAVRTFCKYLVIERVLSRDISAAIDPPKKWHRLPTVLSDDSLRQLLNAPQEDEDTHALRDRAILTLLYATGMRASELVGLKLSDLNTNIGVVRVMGKGSKERIVPVAEEALEAVSQYIEASRSALLRNTSEQALLLSRSGRKLVREDIYRIVRKYVRRVGTRGNVSPHTIRHCFATSLLSRGADLRSVQEMLGHADIASTQIYTHIDASRLKAIHKKYHPRG